jgi:multidrug efflux pump subunit AcrA (membrane-fusion protein)
MVSLTAPISGVVGTFNYSIGAVVSAGETLFDITNLEKVYVETQVFESLPNNMAAGRFIAFSNHDTATYNLKLVSKAQVVNTENQSQKVIFEIVGPAGKFRIGENVRVLQFGTNRIAGLVVPTSAVTDIDGKPAVFIKDKAEQYSIHLSRKANPMH